MELQIKNQRDLVTAYGVMDTLLDLVITGEVVPEVLLGVLEEEADEYDQLQGDEYVAMNVMNALVDEAISELSLELCQDSIRGIVTDYLDEEKRRKAESPMDTKPMVDVLAETIFVEVTEPLVVSAVQEAVREIAKELTFEMEVTSCETALLDEVVPDMVRQEVSEVLYEFELLQTTEQLIDELASEEIRITVDRDFPAIRELLEKRQERDEEAAIKEMSCRIVTDRMMLRALVDGLARSGEQVSIHFASCLTVRF
jgi:hypothetical protein